MKNVTFEKIKIEKVIIIVQQVVLKDITVQTGKLIYEKPVKHVRQI
jgi:hypothetical protein